MIGTHENSQFQSEVHIYTDQIQTSIDLKLDLGQVMIIIDTSERTKKLFENWFFAQLRLESDFFRLAICVSYIIKSTKSSFTFLYQ